MCHHLNSIYKPYTDYVYVEQPPGMSWVERKNSGLSQGSLQGVQM